MVILWNLHSGTKLSGWLLHWLQKSYQRSYIVILNDLCSAIKKIYWTKCCVIDTLRQFCMLFNVLCIVFRSLGFKRKFQTSGSRCRRFYVRQLASLRSFYYSNVTIQKLWQALKLWVLPRLRIPKRLMFSPQETVGIKNISPERKNYKALHTHNKVRISPVHNKLLVVILYDIL